MNQERRSERIVRNQRRSLLIFMHAVQIAAIAVYIMFGPPKMELLPMPMYFAVK